MKDIEIYNFSRHETSLMREYYKEAESRGGAFPRPWPRGQRLITLARAFSFSLP